MTKLLHKDVYLPKEIIVKCQQLHRQWESAVESMHIREHFDDSVKDRSHDYNFDGAVKSLTLTKDNTIWPFEVEVDVKNGRWKVTKYCIRIRYLDTNQDICFSLRPYRGSWNKVLMVTAWMNAHSDHHRTLDMSKYDRSLI